MFLIALDWQLDSKGYELADAGERYGQVIVRNGGKWIATQPLAGKFDMHYAEFAGIETANDLKRFVNKYGYLKSARAWGGASARFEDDSFVFLDEGHDGERVDEHLEAARLMRLVIRTNNAGRKYFPNTQDSLDLTRVLSEEDHGHFTIVPDRKRGFSFEFKATSLMSAMWIQLAQKVSGGTQLRTCLQCGAWFEVGAGTDKRADSKFCKTAHRVAYSRQTQSKGS
jgi:hypothetical protein